MALIVEDGTGLTTAEAYASVAEADAYWAARGGAPTAWIDDPATGTLHLTANPSDGETIVIGSKTYTFQDTLTDSDGNIHIGDTVSATQTNLVAAINLTGDPTDGRYAESMTVNADVTAAAFSSNAMLVTAKTGGTDANSTATTETMGADDNYWEDTTLTGGTDDKEQYMRLGAEYLDLEYGSLYRGRKDDDEQALEWPRHGAYDDNDHIIDSDVVPVNLKRANIEAASRIAAATNHELMPDDDAGGATVESELLQAGPVKISTKYGGGGSANSAQTTYPKIESLLRQLVHPPGRIRRA